MNRIIECVPNFSEGRDQNKISAIAGEIRKIDGVKLLNIESDQDHNRTVITFAGEPQSVFTAAFSAIKKSAEIIDMRNHQGSHPRIGATDVCPFIPVRNTNMDECVALAKKLGEKVGKELGIPVYLYEEASLNSQRKTLPQIREGEYEGLARKMELKEWQPDFGPEEFNPRSGATVIGARKFLIAFNVNLKSLNLAKEIAGKIRESGIKKDGREIRIPGEFKELKALGIELKGRNLAQVSMNLTDYKITGMRAVFERIKELAREKGIEIASSEIVGLLPLEAILESGRFYASGFDSEEDLIKAAIKNLKLDKFSDFDPRKKIIEYMI